LTRVFNFTPESRSSVLLWFGTLVSAWTRVFSFDAAPLTLPALRVVFVFIDFSPLQITTGFALVPWHPEKRERRENRLTKI
jgi:hypothetical protein